MSHRGSQQIAGYPTQRSPARVNAGGPAGRPWSPVTRLQRCAGHTTPPGPRCDRPPAWVSADDEPPADLEGTREGLARARSSGRKLGRPKARWLAGLKDQDGRMPGAFLGWRDGATLRYDNHASRRTAARSHGAVERPLRQGVCTVSNAARAGFRGRAYRQRRGGSRRGPRETRAARGRRHGFGAVPGRGQSLLRTVIDIRLPTAPMRSPFSTVSRAWHVAR